LPDSGPWNNDDQDAGALITTNWFDWSTSPVCASNNVCLGRKRHWTFGTGPRLRLAGARIRTTRPSDQHIPVASALGWPVYPLKLSDTACTFQQWVRLPVGKDSAAGRNNWPDWEHFGWPVSDRYGCPVWIIRGGRFRMEYAAPTWLSSCPWRRCFV